MIVYKITCKVNGKIYIGQTTQRFERYIQRHFQYALSCVDIKHGHRPRKFYAAIRKYGKENFEYEILETCSSANELNEREIYYIQYYDSFTNGYNMTLGGDGGGTCGLYKRTDEIKNKISKALLGHKRSEESKQKQAKTISGENHHLYKVGHKTESIEKMRQNSKGVRNGRSQKWIFTSPEGVIYEFIGGYFRFLKEHKLPRWSIDKVVDGLKKDYKGWTVERTIIHPTIATTPCNSP